MIKMINWGIIWVLSIFSFTSKSTKQTDQRGLSQSTENAILLAGAVTIAIVVVTAIKSYVESHLP